MSDYAGPLQRLVLSRTLWVIVASPLIGLFWQALVARRRIHAASDEQRERARAAARKVAVGTLVLTLASVLAHAVVLARLPAATRLLFEHLARGPRFGLLEADLDLWLDIPSAALALVACHIALVAAFTVSREPRGGSWRTWACLHLALAGALLALLGDGLATVAIGWTLAGAAAAWIAGWHDAHAAVVAGMRGALAVGALLVGAALLFWSLTGSWAGDDFLPDVQPRFASVRIGDGLPADRRGTAEPAEAGEGWVTMTASPGARVFVDDARAASMRAPFVRMPLPAGAHTFRVQAGAGQDEAVVGRVVLARGDEIALVPIGPTLSLHGLADQLTLRNAEGDAAVRDALDGRGGPAGLAVAASVIVAWLLAAAGLSAQPTLLAAPPGLAAAAHGIVGALLGPALLVRAAVLFPLAPHAGTALLAVGAALLLGAAWRAFAYRGARRWMVFASGGAAPALAMMALGRGGVHAAMAVLIAASLIATLARIALGRVRVAGAADIAPDAFAETILVRIPEGIGELLASMEQWVVQAIAGAVGALGRVSAWIAARLDEDVVAAPGDAIAARAARVGRGLEPWVGTSLGSIAWALLALGGAAALVQAFWPGI